MATETYKYFKCDTNLRSEYGGAAIQNAGDSRETTPQTLTHRYVSKQLALPANSTSFLWEMGTATDTFTWIRVPDLHYASVSPYLSAAELATVQSTLPAGWTKTTLSALMQPRRNRKSLLIRGDSIKFGLGTTTGDTIDTWPAQLITSAGETFVWDTNRTEGVSNNYFIGNLSLGSSSWDNSVAVGLGEEAYPKRESLAFAQRVQTLPIFAGTAFMYSLGTNDLAYDATVTGAAAWARAATRITAWKAEFGSTRKFALETQYKRSTASALNTEINAYNVLVRANAATYGYTVFDSEALVPQINISTGDTTNATYYTDGIHVTTATHALIAAAHKTAMLAWLATA